MHVEEPARAPNSVGEFLRSYAMIVLSILTALAFERAAVAWHNHDSARDSRARIEREISADLKELRGAEAANEANLTATKTALRTIMAAFKSSRQADPAVTTLIIDTFRTHMSLQSPTWQREAWDAALADQSVTHLDQADLRHYSEIYANAHDMEQESSFLFSGGLIDRLGELQFDLQLGKPDPAQAARLMYSYLTILTDLTQTQKSLVNVMTTTAP